MKTKQAIQSKIALYEHRMAAIKTIINLPHSRLAYYRLERLIYGLKTRLQAMYQE